jgi:hypothetical protein
MHAIVCHMLCHKMSCSMFMRACLSHQPAALILPYLSSHHVGTAALVLLPSSASTLLSIPPVIPPQNLLLLVRLSVPAAGVQGFARLPDVPTV